jgi:hypothetical protein
MKPPLRRNLRKWATEGPKARAAWDKALGGGAPDPSSCRNIGKNDIVTAECERAGGTIPTFRGGLICGSAAISFWRN